MKKLNYVILGAVLFFGFQNCKPYNSASSTAATDSVSPSENLPTESVPEIIPSEQPTKAISIDQRIDAAKKIVMTKPECSLNQLPEGFYWEIGDQNGMIYSDKVDGTDTPTATQKIAIASASKWLYSSYVLQKIGRLRESDIPFLNFTSGYVYPFSGVSHETSCKATESIGECASEVKLSSTAANRFFYSAGHFQYHATNALGLGNLMANELTIEINRQLGTDDIVYLQTNLAGGANTSASQYAEFLRRMLKNEYVMSNHLGEQKVCASAVCAAGAVLSPAPKDEAWSYSLGHWVEDDPVVGDHAFSSAGALGFYPWIDQSKSWYGVFARRAGSTGGQEGTKSLKCGRLVRKAWISGSADF